VHKIIYSENLTRNFASSALTRLFYVGLSCVRIHIWMGRQQVQGFLLLESHFLSHQARELEQINKKNKYFLQNEVPSQHRPSLQTQTNI